MRIRTSSRRAFTLLEVLLASAIGMVILGAIYLAIDTQTRIAEKSRNLVQQATLARSLTARISSDVIPSIGISDPSRYHSGSSSSGSSSSSSSSSGGSSSGGQGMTTTPSTGSGQGGTPSTTTPSSSSSSSSSSTTTTTDTSPAVRAVVGDQTSLKIYVSRVAPMTSDAAATMQQGTTGGGSTSVANVVTDQRLVTYWLAGGGGQPLGLARSEATLSTGTSDSLPDVIGASNEGDYVIAPEVGGLTFSYYGDNGNGLDWYSTWDGTDTGSDSSTPLGPPLAIAIEFQLLVPGSSADNPQYQTFRHVVAIPTASGTAQTSSSSDSTSTTQP